MNDLRAQLFIIGCVLLSFCPQARAAVLLFGQTQTGTIGSAAQTNSYTFSASANDLVDFTVVTTSGKLSPKIGIYNSSGTLLSSAYGNNGYNQCGGSSLELNTVTLAAAGTYTVLVGDCSDTNTGTYSIYSQRTNNPAGAANLPFGQAQTGTINSATQSNSYTFGANANDVVDFTVVATSGTLSPKIRLYNSSGALLISAYGNNGYNQCGGSSLELNTVTLTATGTYTVLAGDCGDANAGNYSIYVQRTNNPAGAAVLLFGGQPQTGTISSVAQSNSYTFSGGANDGLDFTMVGTKGGLSPKIRLYNPDGTLLSSAYGNNGYNQCGGSSLELNSVKLPATGTYIVLVGDCADSSTGNYNLSVQCFGVCATTPPMQPQTITFGALSNQILGAAPFALYATASSSLSVTFTSNTTSVCTVSGSVVTLVGTGTCSITAGQSGNSSYLAATPVTQTFTVAGNPGPGPVYDLASNWSNSVNPNGPWSVNQGSAPLPFVSNWNAANTTWSSFRRLSN